MAKSKFFNLGIPLREQNAYHLTNDANPSRAKIEAISNCQVQGDIGQQTKRSNTKLYWVQMRTEDQSCDSG